jgi:antirestriction protein ArdC
MGASMLCGFCGILDQTIDNSAAYISGWLGVLKSDKRAVVVAAAKAQRAVDFILDRTEQHSEAQTQLAMAA